MALTRKFLSAMGIEEDKIDQIIEAHSATVNALKEERDKFKDDALKLPDIQKELDEAKESIETHSKDAYKVKYEALKEEYEEYKTGIENGKTREAKEKAYRELLKKVGISEKRIDAVLKVSDVDGIDLDKEGNVKKADELMESIKKEWSDFIVTKSVEGTDTAKPPTNTGGSDMTREQIRAIKDGAERRQKMAENPELFGLASKE